MSIAPGHLVFSMTQPRQSATDRQGPRQFDTHAITMHLLGASASAGMTGEQPLDSRTYYYQASPTARGGPLRTKGVPGKFVESV